MQDQAIAVVLQFIHRGAAVDKLAQPAEQA